MRTKRNLIECLALLLVVYFFQDLLHKISHWRAYGAWFGTLPYVHRLAAPGKYLVTSSEVVVSFGLLFQKSRRMACYLALYGLMTIIVYVILARILSHRFFFPYYLLGIEAQWFHVLLADSLLAWLVLVLIQLNKKSLL
jgi:hypothetical protein